MTNPSEAEPRSILVEIAILSAYLLALIFCIGVAVGYFGAAADHGPTLAEVGVGTVFVLITALCSLKLATRAMRLFKSQRQNPGPNMRKTRRLWAFFIGTGLVSGLSMALLQGGTTSYSPGGTFARHFSDAPISPGLAAGLLVVMVVVTMATIVYYRTIDEHEFATQSFASLVSINVYVIAVVGWWIAFRGGLAPAIQHSIIFGVVIATWIAVWLWRRFR